MRNEGGGFAASIYRAMPKGSIQVTSHSKLLIPSHSSLLSGLARGAGRPLMACKRGGAGSIGSEGSAGAAHKNQKRRGALIALRAHRHFERSPRSLLQNAHRLM